MRGGVNTLKDNREFYHMQGQGAQYNTLPVAGKLLYLLVNAGMRVKYWLRACVERCDKGERDKTE